MGWCAKTRRIICFSGGIHLAPAWATGEPGQEENMSEFTQLNLNTKSQERIAHANQRRKFSAVQKAAALSAVMITSLLGVVLLQTIGCSRQKSQPAASVPANQNPQTAATSAVLPAPASSTAPTPTPAKKAVRKRATLATYTDSESGVSFRSSDEVRRCFWLFEL